MSELLPTPAATDAKGARNRTSSRKADSEHHDGVTLSDAMRMLPTPSAADGERASLKYQGEHNPTLLGAVRTSASSPGSEGWISRWKRTGIPVSDRLSGTPTAPESLSDGGRLFLVGVTSPRSVSPPEAFNSTTLLPTPNATPYGYNQQDSPGAVKRPGLWTLFAGGSPASPPPPPADGKEPPTIAGSGRKSPVSLASYDPELSSWRTSQVSLLSTEDERFPRSSERWPTSGMTRRGRAFALPMSERVTSGSASSYLPTPRAEKLTEAQRDDFTPNLPMRVAALLHTPTTGDTAPSYDHRASPGYTRSIPVPNLAAQIEDELLPTPVADHSRGLAQPGTDFQSLPNVVLSLGEPTSPPSEDGSE